MGGDDTEVGGTVPQRIASCMEALGALLAQPHAVAASMVLADKRRAQQAPKQDLVHAVANILGIKDPSKVCCLFAYYATKLNGLFGVYCRV